MECVSRPVHWLLPYLNVLVPILTITGMTLVRKKQRVGWVISLVNQIPFGLANVLLGAYGFLVLNAFYAWNALWGIIEWKD
jgi:hypothetical protein